MKNRVLGVLAGDRVNLDWLEPWLREADRIYTADGGADLVLKAGFRPDVLLGDLDSVSPAGLASAKKVVRIENQDFSDSEKLLQFALAEGAEELVLCGLEGTRTDHALHAIQSSAKWQGRCLLAYESMLGTLLRGPESLNVKTRGTVSALPLTECEGVTISGVRWPLQAVKMSPLGFSSISNETEDIARLQLQSGCLMVLWTYDGRPFWNTNHDFS
jgi:thiamine pyrophosphokinase